MLKKLGKKAIKWVVDKFIGSGLEQETNVATGERYVTKGMPSLVREAGSEGIVLLKNDGVLPLKRGTKVAVFGRCQWDYLYVGYGSGGDVHAPYVVSLMDALEEGEKKGDISLNHAVIDRYAKWRKTGEAEIDEGFWGHWPMHYPEMPIGDLATEAKKTSDVAIVVIGRTAGEDRENVLEEGSYYLTAVERDLLKKVTSVFDKTIVVLDCGNVIDLKEISSVSPSAIVYAWLGGMESGNALVDVLLGRVNPSGRLSSTIAIDYQDYPSSANFGNPNFNNYAEDIYVGYRYFETFCQDRVLYPFGHGLSYTSFDKTLSTNRTAEGLTFDVTVKNVGAYPGKEVVTLFAECPSGRLSKPSRVLVGFSKTDTLDVGAETTLTINVKPYDYASYDESTSSYILEKGEYKFYLGGSVREAVQCYSYVLEDTAVIATYRNVLKVQEPFCIMTNDNGKVAYKEVFVADYSLKERVLDSIPQARQNSKENYSFCDVREGKVSVEEFVHSLTLDQLEGLTRGIGYMNSQEGVKGNAGSFVGTTKALRKKGVPSVITTDGPAGIRVSYYTSLLPCGTALASTFNTPLVEKLYNKVADEMLHYKTDVLLAPGMNIHRSPLCGRNFEYFSEDPFLSGKTASAVVKGVQDRGVACCPKHFACNNQEEKRFVNDSRVSERALREIYLKGFEICVKEAEPFSIMTSYNKINGVYSYYNYDLVTEVLRKEWGHKGMVMTDWWMRRGVSPDFPLVFDNAYRVRAGVDVLMPGNFSKVLHSYQKDKSLLKNVAKPGGITRQEIEAVAIRVLKSALRLGK